MPRIRRRQDVNVRSCDLLAESDNRLRFLLEECENGARFSTMVKNQFDEVWAKILEAIKKTVNPEQESRHQIRMESLWMMESAVHSEIIKQSGDSASFVDLLNYYNGSDVDLTDLKEIRLLCKINEQWLTTEEIPTSIDVLRRTLFLLKQAMDNQPLVADADRLNALSKLITLENFPVASLKIYVGSFVKVPTLVKSDGGQRFLARIVSLHRDIVADAHNSILMQLRTCDKEMASCYGTLFVSSWHKADDEVKDGIKGCFQSTIERFFKSGRKSLNLTKVDSNMLRFIESWNVEVRKKGSNRFITMVADCYGPILWKYLESGYNHERCNAYDAFFKAFPIIRPGDNAEAQSELFDKQYKCMEAALKDNNHVVRIIAIREVCNIVPVYWSQFTPVQIQQLMTIITKDCVRDTSCVDVRLTVWRGLRSFLTAEDALDYLKQILPPLGPYVNDKNAKVRGAFLQLLIAAREADRDFKYTSIVSHHLLMLQLGTERSPIGKYIVQLVMTKIYNQSMKKREWIRNFSLIIKSYRQSYRNLFLYSKDALSLEDALNIMCSLIEYMGEYVKGRLEDRGDENNSSIVNTTLSRTRHGSSKTRKSSSSRSSEASDSTQTSAFEDPDVVSGLFEIISLLFVANDESIYHENNRGKLLHFYEIYTQRAPMFINYYKGSQLFTSIINMNSNVPMAVLRANSITLPGYCMKKLRTTKLAPHQVVDEEYRSMVLALIKWSQGSVILDHILMSIEAAFEVADCTPSEPSTRKKVKISEDIDADSVLAIRIFDIIMTTKYAREALMQKCYDQLLELWKYMGGIKDLLLRRLELGVPYRHQLLSDDFLQSCLQRYVKLIPLLHPLDPNTQAPVPVIDLQDDDFDCEAEINTVLCWTQDKLMPLLLSDDYGDIELLSSSINAVLRVCDNMINCVLVTPATLGKVDKCITSLLSNNYYSYFLLSAVRISCVTLHMPTEASNDDKNSKMALRIVCEVIRTMVSKAAAGHASEQLEQDGPAIKSVLGKIFNQFEEVFRRENTVNNLKNIRTFMQNILHATRTELSKEIPREDLSIPVYSTVSKLPQISSIVLVPIFNKTYLTPLFLLVLKEQLGRSVKTLLIDVLILHLFGAIKHEKFAANVDSVRTLALERLRFLKARRESAQRGERRSLSVSLCFEKDDPPTEEIEGEKDNDSEMNKQDENLSNAAAHQLNLRERNEVSIRSINASNNTSQGEKDRMSEEDLTEDFVQCIEELLKRPVPSRESGTIQAPLADIQSSSGGAETGSAEVADNLSSSSEESVTGHPQYGDTP